MTTATFVRDLPSPRSGVTRKLWKLSAPVTWREYDKMLGIDHVTGDSPRITRGSLYVVTSKAHHNDYGAMSGNFGLGNVHETFIFPANEHGKILSFGELPGSETGEVSHEEAIAKAGWTVIIPTPKTSHAIP